jgi:hypothetical protein
MAVMTDAGTVVVKTACCKGFGKIAVKAASEAAVNAVGMAAVNSVVIVVVKAAA